MIILVANQKGGSGKTTIATNFAAILAGMSKDVLLVDTDVQCSASDWASIREDSIEAQNSTLPTITCVQKTGRIDQEIKRLSSKFDYIIIDAGGRESQELRSGLVVADICIIPLIASQFDLWAIEKVEELVSITKEHHNPKLIAKILVNKASTHAKVDDHSTIISFLHEGSSKQVLGIFDVSIKERMAFRHAAQQGRAVTELTRKESNPKAIVEIIALLHEVLCHE